MHFFAKLCGLYVILGVSSEICNNRLMQSGPVCVCNATYCDNVPSLPKININNYIMYSSSSNQLGFNSISGQFATNTSLTADITLDTDKRYQKIVGFGGAFTDATGININSLPKGAQDKLLESYFGPDGIQYSLCRVPVGGTDFSTRPYSYQDVPENSSSLANFALQQEDFQFKIPFIQKASALRNNSLKLFATAWSAPPWMKTNNDWTGIGVLKEEFYQLWADYYIKFFEAYAKNGVNFWGMTTQNEPVDGFIPKALNQINAMGWTPSMMNRWIGKNLGPTIRSSKFKDLKIILHDDQRATLPLLRLLLDNEETLEYADGVGVHWYLNSLIPASFLEFGKSSRKELFLLPTEACNGYLFKMGFGVAVDLGSWQRAANYVHDVIDNLNYGAIGWIDWNMVLDMQGGPCYISNFVDSPIIVNSEQKEFYKQPMFYALGHFSKFAIPNSLRIQTNSTLTEVEVVAFLRPDNLTAVILHNRGENKSVAIKTSAGIAQVNLQRQSINTLIF